MHEEETTLSTWIQLPLGGGYYQCYVQEVVPESLYCLSFPFGRRSILKEMPNAFVSSMEGKQSSWILLYGKLTCRIWAGYINPPEIIYASWL
jgi:hypothetical protein